MTQYIRWTALGLIVAGMLVLAPTRVLADQPQTQFIPISFGHPAPSISAVCGFPVTVCSQGTLKLATYVDTMGNSIRTTMNFQDFKITFTGNGASFASPSPDPTSLDYTTGTTVIHGLQLAIHVPGSGLIGIETGTVVIDSSGSVVFRSGQTIVDSAFDSSVCTALGY